jgi:hypothetical protein
MQVFISWSGEVSRQAAEEFKRWLGNVIQAVEPWVSGDIEKGARWGAEVSKKLEQAAFGVICLTADNLNAPWILFEAGALSRNPSERVCTLLLDVVPTQVQPPLSQFQSAAVTSEEIWKLVQSINVAQEFAGVRPLSLHVLRPAFDKWWPELEANLSTIVKSRTADVPPQRPERELMEELLELARVADRRLTSLDNHRTLQQMAAAVRGHNQRTDPHRLGLMGVLSKLSESESAGLEDVDLPDFLRPERPRRPE